MAVKWEVEVERGGDLHCFYPQDIVVKPELNGRTETPNIENLILSIIQHGQMQAVDIRKEDGKPVLVSGFSRYRAIVAINDRKLTPQPLRLKCTYYRGDEQEGFIRNIAENLDRNATTALDDAYNFRKLTQWGKTTTEIAELIHRSTAFVEDRLALCEAIPEVKSAIREGRLSPSAAKTLAKATVTAQRSAVTGTGKVTTRDAVKATGKRQGATTKELREFIEGYTGPGEEKAVRDFARQLLKKIDGE